MMEFVSWDDEIPNIWKNVPNHRPNNDINNVYKKRNTIILMTTTIITTTILT
jgi:hypothetical protein